ncbi:Gfo/Idh/MocA family oxidoreductase [Micromonospora sp. NPDC047134]|uniref:Gfo/Idh/MocA family protein n=1 Tax=Micromonospora sp. NPDC047134 TaxID=3154340 RepID=UPI0033DF9E7D
MCNLRGECTARSFTPRRGGVLRHTAHPIRGFRRVKIVVIGHGRAGRQHISAIACSPEVKLHSVLETNSAVQIGDLPRADSWEAVLLDPSVDAVSLCVPPGGRARLAQEALAAGKGVLLEKPPAMSAAELADLESWSIAAGRPAAVMLQHRYALPEPVLAAEWGGNAAGTLLVSRPRSAHHFTGWRGDPGQALGGIVAHLGVHYLDLACQLLGEPASVTVTDRAECRPGIDTRCAGVITFATGATLAFIITAEADARAERLSIVGPAGWLDIADGAVRAGLDGCDIDTEPIGGGELRRRVLDEFAQAVATGTAPDRCGLARTRGVTWLLERTTPVTTP